MRKWSSMFWKLPVWIVIVFTVFVYRSDNMSEAVDDAMPEPGHSLEDEEAIDDMWPEADEDDVKEPTNNCWVLWFLIKLFDNKDDKNINKKNLKLKCAQEVWDFLLKGWTKR